MRTNTYRLVSLSLLIIITLLLILGNVQFFFNAKYFSDVIMPSEAGLDAADSDMSTQIEYGGMPGYSVKSKLEDRSVIDDCINPTLWSGTDIEVDVAGAVGTGSNGKAAEAYRKYDRMLDLQSYMYIELDVVGLENIDWIAMYLMEDLSYANYFECDLIPMLNEGENNIIISKKDFLIGTGSPLWNEVSTVKIGFQSKQTTTSHISIKEISTYDARPVCSIWFDDGWQTTYTNALPLMQEKDFPGTLSVISSHVGYEQFCSKTELDALYSAGWDFTNHTHSHKNLSEISLQEAENEIAACYEYLESNGYSRASNHFVPPYCVTNDNIDEIIAKYAITSRPQWDSFNTLPVQDSYNLCFMEVMPDVKPETVHGWIDEAIANDLWLVLLFHSIETPADTPTKYDVQNFNKILDYLDANKTDIDVATISQVFDANYIEQQENVAQGNSMWKLVWADEFDQASLDTAAWNIVETAPFKNNELQTYQKENVAVEDGYLKIISTKENDIYYSGALTTDSKQIMQYGKVEIRAKLPEGKGIFPAIWMLPQSGVLLPEIDIIEFLGDKPNEIWHVMHFIKDGKKDRRYIKFNGVKYSQDFHVFSIEWTKEGVTWKIDGIETFFTDAYIPSDKMYLYINTAIGGNWPGSPNSATQFPQTMLIDYVKYYKQNG